ncbi:AAA family ATPase [Streptomyces sp. NPDC058268]|uniref:AAA family ATPase n=1 Tax=Streptomyces sp. NPDC058268 TaxID=3346413 RepID=UPI0036E79026
MFLIGFKIQDVSSPKQKTYTTVATPTGLVHTSYGPHHGAQNRSTPKKYNATGLTDPTQLATQAFKELRRLWNAKRGGGYNDVLIKPVVLEAKLSEAEAADVDKALDYFERYGNSPQGTFLDAPEPQALEGPFITQKVTSSSQVLGAGRPRTRPVSTRTAAITGDPVYIRPNGDTYRPRDLGGHHDVALLQAMRTAGIPVRLYGLPGTGKSALAEAAFGQDLITINGHGDMTVSHFVGSYLPQNDGTFKWTDGPLTRAMKEGRPLFVDEITRIPSEVLAVLYAVLDGRGTLSLDDKPDAPVITAAAGFWAICGYNPEGIGVRQLDDALVSRFAVGVEVTTDLAAARALGVPQKFIKLAENLTTKDVEDRAKGGAGVWVPQMRELLLAMKVATSAGEMFAASVITGQCPRPEDVPQVADVATKVFGATVTPLALGGQV